MPANIEDPSPKANDTRGWDAKHTDERAAVAAGPEFGTTTAVTSSRRTRRKAPVTMATSGSTVRVAAATSARRRTRLYDDFGAGDRCCASSESDVPRCGCRRGEEVRWRCDVDAATITDATGTSCAVPRGTAWRARRGGAGRSGSFVELLRGKNRTGLNGHPSGSKLLIKERAPFFWKAVVSLRWSQGQAGVTSSANTLPARLRSACVTPS